MHHLHDLSLGRVDGERVSTAHVRSPSSHWRRRHCAEQWRRESTSAATSSIPPDTVQTCPTPSHQHRTRPPTAVSHLLPWMNTTTARLICSQRLDQVNVTFPIASHPLPDSSPHSPPPPSLLTSPPSLLPSLHTVTYSIHAPSTFNSPTPHSTHFHTHFTLTPHSLHTHSTLTSHSLHTHFTLSQPSLTLTPPPPPPPPPPPHAGESDAKQSCLVEEGILKDSVPKGGEGEKKEFPLPLKVCKV